MSNILNIRVIEARTLGEQFIEYEIRASDAYHEATINTFDSLAKLYQNFNSQEQLVGAVDALDDFEGLAYTVNDDGTLALDDDAPYSGINIEGFYPGVALTCDDGHPLLYMANNRFSTSLLFADDAKREVYAQEHQVDEQVICNHPDCQAKIHPQARQRVLEEGRQYHRTNPLHR